MNLDWSSLLLGVLPSLIISFIFFKLGTKTTKFVYNIKSTPLISNKISQIQGLYITFNDKEIQNLISTTISIENKGTENIQFKDFASRKPLQIKCTEDFL